MKWTKGQWQGVEFLTDGQNDLLTEKTGCAKPKIQWIHCLAILSEDLGNRIRNRYTSQGNEKNIKERLGCAKIRSVT